MIKYYHTDDNGNTEKPFPSTNRSMGKQNIFYVYLTLHWKHAAFSYMILRLLEIAVAHMIETVVY